MPTIHLDHWKKRPYGVYAPGYVDSGDKRIGITVRSPHEGIFEDAAPKIVNFNGITLGGESMRMAAETAADLGYVAITLDYSNTKDYETPLQSNAQDGLDVMEAFNPEDCRFMGLSMGGAVATVAAAQSKRPITNLDLISPGGFTDHVIGLHKFFVADAIRHEINDEALAALRHPYLASSVAISSIANCRRRPNAVRAEASQLLRETVYDYLADIRRKSPETTVTLTHGRNDKLVPRKELLESLRAHEKSAECSLVDIEIPHNGGHADLMFRPELTTRILLASAGLALRTPVK